MRSVRATEKFSVYWNYQVWHLAAGEQVDGELADYLLATSSPVEEILAEPAVDTDGDGVPDGTAAQVLDWVGNDLGRAVAALAAEMAKERPRSTLVAALQKLISAAEPETPTGEQPPVPPVVSSDEGQSTTPVAPAEPES